MGVECREFPDQLVVAMPQRWDHRRRQAVGVPQPVHPRVEVVPLVECLVRGEEVPVDWAQRALIVDAVRAELHPDDVLAFDHTTGRLVVLVAPAAAEAVAVQLSRRVREVVGIELQFLLAPIAPQARPVDEFGQPVFDGERL